MRTLTTSIQNALAAAARTPASSVQLFDPIQHYASYQTGGLLEGISAACLASDGAIIRAFTTQPTGAFVASLDVQRISDPGNSTQWNTWTSLSSGNLLRDAGCAVSNNSGTLHVFAQSGSSPYNLLVWTSTDNGATWSGPVTIAAINAAIRGLGSAGQNDVFYAYDITGGEALAVSRFSSGAWSSPATWTLGVIPANVGLDAAWDSANSRYLLAVSDGRQITGYSYTPSGGVWALVGSIAPLDSATSLGLGRFYPRLQLFDGLYNLSYVEVDNGAFTGLTYSYARLRQSSDFIHWSDGTLLSQTFAFGPTWLKAPTPPTGSAGPAYYVLDNTYAWRAPVYNPANPSSLLDVSAQVLAFQRVEKNQHAGQVSLRLSNVGGQYNSPPMLGLNTSIALAEGYHDPTSGTPSTVTVGIYYVDRCQYLRAPDHNELLITASDATKRLDHAARLQTSYSGQTLAWLLTELAARAGLFAVHIPTTNQFTQVVPVFVMPASQTLRQALDELCSIYDVYYFLDQTETLQFRELSAADLSVWTYQPEIETLTLGSDDLRANHVIVTGRAAGGAQVFGESYDFAHITQTGQERPLYRTDPRLTTATQAALKAGFLLADEQRAGTHHTINVPANPGLQLLDVVTVTDSAAPTGTGQSTNARISTLDVTYTPQQALFDMTLTLEQP
ncbi:MAG TPA: hypothetical protein VKT82_03170 [Ktedonobacterales bacterium]|nr:hypothetical protein [Ktedonobacterales bacterium]